MRIAVSNAAPGRWLITGAAGFIGSNFARFLLERGEGVVGFDNFFSGKRANVDRLAQRFSRNFEFVEGDILDSVAITAAVRDCTAVAHLAAQISVIRSIEQPQETHAINGTGFLNTYLAAARAGVPRLVYASSCAIYGDNLAMPLREDAEARPLSPYAASKLANEAYAAALAAAAPRMRAIGLRFFNIFGAWQNATGGYSAVIPKWIDRLMAGQQPILFGDGSAIRDFCHVDNVCEAIHCAADAELGGNHAVFNVATGVPTRLDTLYDTICRTLRAGGIDRDLPAPVRHPERSGDIRCSVADTRNAAAGLGLCANVGLEEGLRRLLSEEHGLTFAPDARSSAKSGMGS